MGKKISVSKYRYERKSLITELSRFEVESVVKMHPAFFSEIYYSRFINNIYFDSFNYINFRDNVEGATDRIKIRIRWYGDLFGQVDKPVLEIKIKKGALGKKISIPMQSFVLTRETNITDILTSIRYLKEDLMIDIQSLVPTLLNRYSRKYYQSSNKKFRITIDDQQSYHKIQLENNSFLDNYIDYDSVILELKYDQENDQEAQDITTIFPFRITKNSKYVTGVQKIFQLVV
jgi:hypothetical protein